LRQIKHAAASATENALSLLATFKVNLAGQLVPKLWLGNLVLQALACFKFLRKLELPGLVPKLELGNEPRPAYATSQSGTLSCLKHYSDRNNPLHPDPHAGFV
jgi:hypothetical protein